MMMTPTDHGQEVSSMPSLADISSRNLIAISVLSLNLKLSFAKYAGWNTWPYNIPE